MTVKAFLKGEEKKRVAKQEAAAKEEAAKTEVETVIASTEDAPQTNGTPKSGAEQDVKVQSEIKDEVDDGAASPASSISVEVCVAQVLHAAYVADNFDSSSWKHLKSELLRGSHLSLVSALHA